MKRLTYLCLVSLFRDCIVFLDGRFKQLRSLRKWGAFLAAICLFVEVTPAVAITFDLIYVAGATNQNDPTGTQLMSIMQSAANRWADIIEDNYTMTLNVTYHVSDAMGNSICGNNNTTACSGVITLNANQNRTLVGTVSFFANRNWFIDPTPNDNSEFDLAQTLYLDLPADQKSAGFTGLSIEQLLEVGFRGPDNGSNTNVNGNFDMVGTALHEIGHLVGVTNQYQAAMNELVDDDYDIPPSLLGGGNMAVRAVPGGEEHFVNAFPLMSGIGVDTGIRRLPAAADVLAAAAVGGWTQIDLPRKDFLTGTAWETAANWVGNHVPDGQDDVYIRHGAAASVNIPISVPNLSIGRSSQLTVSNMASVGELQVGSEGLGTSTLVVAGGGDVVSTIGIIGLSASSSGTATVLHSGSTWTNSGDLIVGYRSGTSSLLDIRGGGAVSSNRGFIGDDVGARGNVSVNGAATVLGTGATWNSGVELRIGNLGHGTLNVSDGGDVSSTVGRIGYEVASIGAATVTGAGSTWTNSGDLIVGYKSENFNTLNVQSGAAVSSNRGFLGDDYNARGTANVSGTGLFGSSMWNSGTELRVGNLGNGTLNVTNEGDVSSTVGYIATYFYSIGTATIDGAGSTWNMGAELRVGNGGAGMLNVTNGGDVANTVGYVGLFAGSTGTATVSGAGSTWTNSGDLIVGYQSAAANTVNIQSGGLVTSNRGIIGDFGGASGTVSVAGAGSRWNIASELRVGNVGTGRMIVQNGGLVVSSGSTIGVHPNSNGGVTVGGGGATWTIDGNLLVGSAGTGSLAVKTGGLVTGGLITIQPLGTLQGEGTITADVTNNGAVRPGAGGDYSGIATLQINGNYGQSSLGTLDFELFSATNFARLSATGNVGLSGMLKATLIDGFAPQVGDAFDILNWGNLFGSFTSIQLPTLPGSKQWNLSQLYSSGVISVISAASLPGDFNNDNVVDSADYVVWRKNAGTQADYNAWRSHFGQTAGSGAAIPSAASLSPSVPEPVSATLAALGVLGLVACAPRRQPRSRDGDFSSR